MHKLRLILFYSFASEIGRAKHIRAGSDPFEVYMELMGVVDALQSFLGETAPVPMDNTKGAARALLEYIQPLSENLIDEAKKGNRTPLTTGEVVQLFTLVENFEREFEHDSRELNIFSVSDVGTHSTTKLLENAHLNLSADVRSRLSDEVVNDIKAAGRCLAFDTPTAAGFHILRAVEPLILEYHNRVTGTVLPLKSRSWGTYIERLGKRGGEAKIVGMIQHIKDFYRNPIMHPEATLTPDQALSLFYTCLSAIVYAGSCGGGRSCGVPAFWRDALEDIRRGRVLTRR